MEKKLLPSIVTRTGDGGETHVANGMRLSKNDLRIHAIGEVDELNSVIGVVLAQQPPVEIQTILIKIQHHLFGIGAMLAHSQAKVCCPKEVDQR